MALVRHQLSKQGACKDVQRKSSYYVWYLGAREARALEAMPAAVDYLLERERLQEPFKVTLQVSGKGLKIIQTIHPGGSMRSAVKQLVPGHALLAAVQREDVVAAAILLPNPATNNPVHVHAYRCDSVETAELLGGQLGSLASQTDSLVRMMSLDRRPGHLGSDGRSTRESESSESSGEALRASVVPGASVYESLAAELRAKLADAETGPLLLPPRDYDTVHRQRGNLAAVELRRCLNQTIVGEQERGSRPTRSAGSSGIGSDSAATPPPYSNPIITQHHRPSSHPHQHHHSNNNTSNSLHHHHHQGTLLASSGNNRGNARTPGTRDSSSDEDWNCTPGADYPLGLGPNEHQHDPTMVNLPRVGRAGSRSPVQQEWRAPLPPTTTTNRGRSPKELALSPRERFQDAKEKFRQMEREANVRPPLTGPPPRPVRASPHVRSEPVSRQASRNDEQRPVSRQLSQSFTSSIGSLTRENYHDRLQREKQPIHQHHYRRSCPTDLGVASVLPDYPPKPSQQPKPVLYGMSDARPPELGRPRSFYEVPAAARELRGPRTPEALSPGQFQNRAEILRLRGLQQQRSQIPTKDFGYHHSEFKEHESAPARYRHSYAEPPARLGLAGLYPY